MRYEEVLSALKTLSARGMDFGLERERALLKSLKNPDEKLKIIHIAGTNGKGSVAEYMTRILQAAGKRAGTFTSPAVYGYAEQFRIDGENIGDPLFCTAAERVLTVAGNATEFEAETAIALYAFALAGCEYAVIECGLGGTYDATNAILRKRLALITSVSCEHTEILGKDLADICTHKAGIIKNCPVVASALQPPAALEFFKAKGINITDEISGAVDGHSFVYRGKRFEILMRGAAQPYNAALAIEGARILGIDENAIYSGVKSTNLGGRMEFLSAGGVSYILDGAHNPQSFFPLINYLRGLKAEDVTVVYGCLADKDITACVRGLSCVADRIVAVQPDSPRAKKLGEIFNVCKNLFGHAEKAESVSCALGKANGGTVVVCGSFTLLKEAKSWIEKR